MSDEPKKRRGKAVKDKRGEPATFVPGNGAGPKQFDAQAVAEEIKLYWENEGGDNFWINNAAGWSKWPLKALENLMTRHMVRAKKREGEFLSDSQQLLLYVREHRCVDEVMSAISGYPAGRYELSSGHRVIVRYPPKLIEPKEGDWGVVKELIESKLNLSLNMVPGPDQTAYFHGWMKTALEGCSLVALAISGRGSVASSRGRGTRGSLVFSIRSSLACWVGGVRTRARIYSDERISTGRCSRLST
jgi:hypothetical protein